MYTMYTYDGDELEVEFVPAEDSVHPIRVGLGGNGAYLTPAEARRVAAALVKEAEKAEKKGKQKVPR